MLLKHSANQNGTPLSWLKTLALSQLHVKNVHKKSGTSPHNDDVDRSAIHDVPGVDPAFFVL
jgi:hypothetical protein